MFKLTLDNVLGLVTFTLLLLWSTFLICVVDDGTDYDGEN